MPFSSSLNRIARGLAAGLSCCLLSGIASSAPPASADLVVTHAKIYLPAGKTAQALAVHHGRIIFVGSAADAKRLVGPATVVQDVGGARVLPGLVDAHIHPLGIVDFDHCNLENKALSLHQLSDFVKACLEKYHTKPGEWLEVEEWSYGGGNQGEPGYSTIREALDKASTASLIQVTGSDGHHGAFNSLALAQAKNVSGATVGMSKRTIDSDFSQFRKLISVDSTGEPDGAVTEDARLAVHKDDHLVANFKELMHAPERMTQRLNSEGITTIFDAMARPQDMEAFDTLQERGQLTVNVTLAQFYDPEEYRGPGGQVDFDAIIKTATTVRTKYAKNPLIRADFLKLFADGALEGGSPYAVPPTLPEAAVLHEYRQPIFGKDADGLATVIGYVDTHSKLCAATRDQMASYDDPGKAQAFLKEHGFHPAQCTISNGQLQHDLATTMEFVKRGHLAGFNMHIHSEGDRSTRTAIDAIEAARQADGNSKTHDSFAHLQFSDPADVDRIGKDHLYVAFTFAWFDVEKGYDMIVVPFIDEVRGNTEADLHPANGRYEKNAYAAKSVLKAGGILAGGSDAPVETSDPHPFWNIAHGITRRHPGHRALNPSQALTASEVIDAYTLGGAQMMGRDQEIGSIEVGKSADFIVLDRDIVALGDAGRGDEINDTKVLKTWFQGKLVYSAPESR